MTEISQCASFPLVFFDGDRDVDAGYVTVSAVLNFKKFQALTAQKIGVSSHQISISLVRRKKARSSPEIRRKVPIDDSSDFAAIARERDCFVLAVMRRSRSGRRGRGRRGRHGAAASGSSDEKTAEAIEVVPELTILKRIHHQEERVVPIGSIGFWDYEAQLRNLQRMQERYLMSTVSPYYAYTHQPAVPVGGVYVPPPPPPPLAACEECVDAKRNGRSPGFHRCVYDKITVGFRSPAGPIERPAKKNVEASVA